MGFVIGMRAVGYTQSKRRFPAFFDSSVPTTATDAIARDGSRPPTAAQPWNGQDLTNVGQLGVGIAVPVSVSHVYEDTASTGATAGLTIEQDGTGDAVAQYLLTGGQRWVTGIDNSAGDRYRIAPNADLSTNTLGLHMDANGHTGINTIPDGTYALNVSGLAVTHPSSASLVRLRTGTNIADLSMDTSGNVSFKNSNAGASTYIDFQSFGVRFRDAAGGNAQKASVTATGLGVGSAFPSDLLHVTATGNANALRVNNTTGNVGIKQASDATHALAVTGLTSIDIRYAEIYVQGGAVSQAITTGGTYEKFIGFTTDAASNGMTAAAASDKITVTQAGHYDVKFQISFSGTNSSTVDFRINWNGVAQNQLHCKRKLGTGGDVGSCSIVGIIDATAATTDIEVWFTTDGTGDNIVAVDAQLTATWLGST